MLYTFFDGHLVKAFQNLNFTCFFFVRLPLIAGYETKKIALGNP